MGLFGGGLSTLINPVDTMINMATGSKKAADNLDPMSLTSNWSQRVGRWLGKEATMPFDEARWWSNVLQGREGNSLPALMASHDALHARSTRELNQNNWMARHPDETAAMVWSLGSATGAFGGSGAAGGAADAGESGSAAGAGSSSYDLGADAYAGTGVGSGAGAGSSSYDLGADAYAGTGVGGGGAGTAAPASSSYDLGSDAYAGTGIGDASVPYDIGSDSYAGTGIGGDIAPSDGSAGLGSAGDMGASTSEENPWYKELLQRMGGKGGGTAGKTNYLKSAMGAMQLYGGLKQMQEKRAYDRQRQSYQDQINNLMRNPSSVTSSPEFLAGQQAIMRSMAAQGYQGSGNMAAALAGNAGTAYARQLARLSDMESNVPQMSTMQPLGNIGLGAYSMLSNI